MAEVDDALQLAGATFMLMLPVVQTLAAMNGMTAAQWWAGFALHAARNTQW